jgi:hypothetical protein
MKTAKLIIGIVSIVLFAIIIFQSCAAGLVNAVSENTSDASGSAGALLGFSMLIAGIIGVAARNTKGGSITAGIFYLVSALVGFANLGTFGDLVVWSVVAAAFGAVFLVSGFTMPKKPGTDNDANT